jgi:O-antigen ligase
MFFITKNQKTMPKLFSAALWVFPLMFFLLHSWVNIVGFSLALIATLLLWQQPKQNSGVDQSSLWVIITLSSMLFSVLISSALRGQLLLPMLDGPWHYLLAIPIFFAIKQEKINFSKLFEYSCPIALLLFALSSYIHPLFFPLHPDEIQRRIAPAIHDPNLVGIYTMTFAFICFGSFAWHHDTKFLSILKIMGFISGVTLSCLAASRSGWLIGLVFFIFWLYLHMRKWSLKKSLFLMTIVIGTLLIGVYLIEHSHNRVADAMHEILLWSNGQNKDTSAGSRLTMWPIALRLFSMHPFQGYADHHLAAYFSDPFIKHIATPYALDTIQMIGPHNDILQNMILSGIFGLFATLLVLFVPLFLFCKIYLRSRQVSTKKCCAQGLYLVTGIFIGGFFNVSLGLKMSVTFYAIVVYSLLATALWQHKIGFNAKD